MGREAEDHEQHWLWIGISRRNSDSWTWSDGSAVSYLHFFELNYFIVLEVHIYINEKLL